MFQSKNGSRCLHAGKHWNEFTRVPQSAVIWHNYTFWSVWNNTALLWSSHQSKSRRQGNAETHEWSSKNTHEPPHETGGIIYQQLFCSVVNRFDACARTRELHIKITYLPPPPPPTHTTINFYVEKHKQPALLMSRIFVLRKPVCALLCIHACFRLPVQTAVCQCLMWNIAVPKDFK